MIEILKEKFEDWITEVINTLKKDTFQKLVIIFISPFIIHAMAEALVDFSLFATIGYYVACIWGFSKILEDPYRMLKWGLGYALGSSAFSLVLSMAWPELKKGTSISIFSGLVMLYVLFMVWWKAKELKE